MQVESAPASPASASAQRACHALALPRPTVAECALCPWRRRLSSSVAATAATVVVAAILIELAAVHRRRRHRDRRRRGRLLPCPSFLVALVLVSSWSTCLSRSSTVESHPRSPPPRAPPVARRLPRAPPVARRLPRAPPVARRLPRAVSAACCMGTPAGARSHCGASDRGASDCGASDGGQSDGGHGGRVERACTPPQHSTLARRDPVQRIPELLSTCSNCLHKLLGLKNSLSNDLTSEIVCQTIRPLRNSLPNN